MLLLYISQQSLQAGSEPSIHYIPEDWFKIDENIQTLPINPLYVVTNIMLDTFALNKFYRDNDDGGSVSQGRGGRNFFFASKKYKQSPGLKQQ